MRVVFVLVVTGAKKGQLVLEFGLECDNINVMSEGANMIPDKL